MLITHNNIPVEHPYWWLWWTVFPWATCPKGSRVLSCHNSRQTGINTIFHVALNGLAVILNIHWDHSWIKCHDLNPKEQLRSKFWTHRTYSNFGAACQISHIFPTVEQPVKQLNCSHSTAMESPAKVYTNQSYLHSTAEEQTVKSKQIRRSCNTTARQVLGKLHVG